MSNNPKRLDAIGLALSAVHHFDSTAENFTSNRVIIGKELYDELCEMSSAVIVDNTLTKKMFTRLCDDLVVIDYGKGRERVFEVAFAHNYEMPKKEIPNEQRLQYDV